jgi:endonuclease YncB( thermonuclease family)
VPARPTIRCVRLFLALALAAAPSARAAEAKWHVFEGCRLDGGYADGDSFHARVGDATYIFRLYFVDAPETDESFPDRVREQADYWRIDPRDVLRLGGEARRFTQAALREPFTVHTRFEDARGRSDQPRHFALVRTAGGAWLADALVSNGLARVHGSQARLPDGSSARDYWDRLEELERKAKAARRGAWAPLGARPRDVPTVPPGARR